jgi:hypothetical protein
LSATSISFYYIFWVTSITCLSFSLGILLESPRESTPFATPELPEKKQVAGGPNSDKTNLVHRRRYGFYE